MWCSQGFCSSSSLKFDKQHQWKDKNSQLQCWSSFRTLAHRTLVERFIAFFDHGWLLNFWVFQHSTRNVEILHPSGLCDERSLFRIYLGIGLRGVGALNINLGKPSSSFSCHDRALGQENTPPRINRNCIFNNGIILEKVKLPVCKLFTQFKLREMSITGFTVSCIKSIWTYFSQDRENFIVLAEHVNMHQNIERAEE